MRAWSGTGVARVCGATSSQLPGVSNVPAPVCSSQLGCGPETAVPRRWLWEDNRDRAARGVLSAACRTLTPVPHQGTDTGCHGDHGRDTPGVAPVAEGPSQHPGWVRGSAVQAPGDVVPFLCEGARHRARRALRLYKSTDPWDLLDAGADAGGAVELLVKACIAAVEPALLAKGGSGLTPAETMLRLRGHGKVLDPDREPRLVTLDATVAVEMAERLFPKLTTVSSGARAALEARNDSMHMGIAITDRVDAAVAGMARFVVVALPLLGLSSGQFWGDEDDVKAAGRAVDTRMSHIAEVIAAKIELAAARHARFLLRFTEDEAANVATALLAKHQERAEVRPGFPERCPACGNDGWVALDADFDLEPDGGGGWTYLQTDEWVEGFECPVCQLELNSEECEEAGIGSRVRGEDDERDT